ncbi:helix-turn-helix domain-containing protein [Cereibacter sphaeroides]|uniref:helix-turn-helix domain-containing protein n=1 Tax=Cereibacter sphaeroides TaxID=1063 RepID=UPI001F39F1C7|nr:helix-turn-helix domain-containing protein [Cereibacter sphaeroides]MCE6967452.1 helix-turn-helix domain-containing protein [Cereibacter sphaeroides]
MDRRGEHLSSEERGVIFAEHGRGSSQRVIGALIGRPASTIGRELARGRQDDGSYCPQAGRLVHEVRRKAPLALTASTPLRTSARALSRRQIFSHRWTVRIRQSGYARVGHLQTVKELPSGNARVGFEPGFQCLGHRFQRIRHGSVSGLRGLGPRRGAGPPRWSARQP